MESTTTFAQPPATICSQASVCSEALASDLRAKKRCQLSAHLRGARLHHLHPVSCTSRSLGLFVIVSHATVKLALTETPPISRVGEPKSIIASLPGDRIASTIGMAAKVTGENQSVPGAGAAHNDEKIEYVADTIQLHKI